MRRHRFGSLAIASLALAALSAVVAGCGSSSDGSVTATTVVTTPAGASSSPGFRLIAASEAAAMLATPPAGLVVLDVRTPEEFSTGHLAGAVDVDFQSANFATELAALDPDVPYLVYCHSGNRSGQAVQAMQQLGFTTVSDLDGGITAWQAAGYPISG